MTLIDRYIARTIFVATFVVALVIVALVLLIGVINQLDQLGHGNYYVLEMLGFVLLQLPGRLLLTVPAIALLGSLAGLGALATHSELIVIRGAGLSMRRLAASVAIAGVTLGSITFAMSAYIAPLSHAKALSLQRQALHAGGQGAERLGDSVWLRQGETVLRFGSVLPDGHLTDIRVYRLGSGGQIEKMLAADSGRVADDHLIVAEPRITNLSLKRLTTDQPEQRRLSVSIDKDILKLAVTEPGQLTIGGLYQYINFLRANDVDATRYQLAFWKQIATPITTLVLSIFALPFAIGALRGAGAGQRLFIGGLGGLAFVLLDRIVAAMAPVYGVWPPLAALLPTLLLAAVTAVWIRRLD